MEDQRMTLRYISWREVCPWLLLFRVFGIAIRLPVLTMALAGCALTALGWQVGEGLFLDPEHIRGTTLARVASDHGQFPGAPTRGRIPAGWSGAWEKALGYGPQAANQLARSVAVVFQPPREVTRLAYHLFGGLWMLIIWGLFGGAISRIAAVQLGRHERIGLVRSLRFSLRRLFSYVAAPLLPLCGVGFMVVCLLLQGLVMSAGPIGVLIGGLLWVLTMIAAALSMVLMLGLLFGWPLMFVAISTEEGGDTFEALSRSYAYSFQRPLHYLFYVLVAVGLGGLGWVLVDAFCESVIQFAYWSAGWGMGEEMPVLIATAEQGGGQGAGGVGAWTIGVCGRVVRAIADSYHYSFLWCAATAIYMLLRRDVDEAEFDEVYLEDDENRYGLPPMEKDEQGVPRVAEAPDDSAEKET